MPQEAAAIALPAVVGIGNALVDVIAHHDDAFITFRVVAQFLDEGELVGAPGAVQHRQRQLLVAPQRVIARRVLEIVGMVEGLVEDDLETAVTVVGG